MPTAGTSVTPATASAAVRATSAGLDPVQHGERSAPTRAARCPAGYARTVGGTSEVRRDHRRRRGRGDPGRRGQGQDRRHAGARRTDKINCGPGKDEARPRQGLEVQGQRPARRSSTGRRDNPMTGRPGESPRSHPHRGGARDPLERRRDRWLRIRPRRGRRPGRRSSRVTREFGADPDGRRDPRRSDRVRHRRPLPRRERRHRDLLRRQLRRFDRRLRGQHERRRRRGLVLLRQRLLLRRRRRGDRRSSRATGSGGTTGTGARPIGFPAVVGSWPEPFLHGYDGQAITTPWWSVSARTGDCDDGRRGAAGGRRRARGGERSARPVEHPDELRVLVGPWDALSADPAARQLESGPGQQRRLRADRPLRGGLA